MLAQRTGHDKEIEKHYHSPLWALYRVDLQWGLARRAKEIGVTLRLAAEVTDVDLSAPAVRLTKGEHIEGDLVVAAVGLWSPTSLFLGRHTPPQPTGHMAFRIVIHVDEVEDSELKTFMAQPISSLWFGPQAHAVAYPVRGGKLLNIILLVMDDLPEDTAKASANLEEMIFGNKF